MRMPEVGQEFFWCGTRFRREQGDINSEGLFPVVYLEALDERVKVGTEGLMQVSEVEHFTLIEHCDKCGQELPRPRR